MTQLLYHKAADDVVNSSRRRSSVVGGMRFLYALLFGKDVESGVTARTKC